MRDPLVGMYVRDLTSEPVQTASHTKSLIRQGNTNRSVGCTNLNEQSSRSHMLVTLTVRTTDLHTNDHYVGKLSLVDLAGSERLSKSQTTGSQLKETQAINKSLSALGTVIASLAQQEKHVPYRDSKLTYMLQVRTMPQDDSCVRCDADLRTACCRTRSAATRRRSCSCRLARRR